MAETAKKSPRKPSSTQPAPASVPAAAARPLRGVVPSLSGVQAAALRGFFASPQAWTLRDNGLLQFMPGKPAPAAQTFEIDAEGTRLALSLQAPAPAAAGVHWSDYHGRSRVLAWSLAHEAQLMRLSEAFGVVLTPLPEPGETAHDATSQLWLDFIVDEDPGSGTASRMPALQGALRAPAAWIDRLLERADPPYDDAPQPLGGWRELGVPMSLQLAIAPLPFAEWSALRPGDVVIVGRRSQLPRAQARVRGLAWPLTAVADGWKISGPPHHLQTDVQETPEMNDDTNGADEGAAAEAGNHATADTDALARRLPVDISFELGQSELRVGELASLQPGYVFPLAAPLEGANVTIRANGQAVGRGEVVAVGDTLGVRLLWWN